MHSLGYWSCEKFDFTTRKATFWSPRQVGRPIPETWFSDSSRALSTPTGGSTVKHISIHMPGVQHNIVRRAELVNPISAHRIQMYQTISKKSFLGRREAYLNHAGDLRILTNLPTFTTAVIHTNFITNLPTYEFNQLTNS